MSEPKGQILPGSKFGDALTELAKQCEKIVEIGTWHGQGSTLCLARGLIRPSQRIWTIEQSPEMWLEASRWYKDPRIRFINGHALGVIDELPQAIDMVLFDGSDETTDQEFDALLPRLTIAALDDTKERKNAKQRAMLLNLKWAVIGDDQTDRNGWAIFKRP